MVPDRDAFNAGAHEMKSTAVFDNSKDSQSALFAL